MALSVAVVAYAAARLRALLFVAPAELGPVRSAVASALDAGDLRLLAVLGARLGRRWLGRVLRAHVGALGAVERDPALGERQRSWRDREAARLSVEESLVDLHAEASAGLLGLRVAVTASSTLGLMLAMVALARGHEPLPGLLALDRGLGARLALESALGHVTLGLVTATVVFRARAALLRAGRALLRDVDILAADLAAAELVAGPDDPRPTGKEAAR
jgi:hypothetical protein